MGLFTKDIQNMEDLFLHTLEDIYYAENQIVKALPTMIEKATSRELTAGLRSHLKETQGHIVRLEQVFHKLGKDPKGVDCPAIDGIIKEAKEVAGEVADKEVLDAAIVGSAQAVEHYEITRYGTLIAWAKILGHQNVVSLLNANLKEEKAADKKLTSIAESKVNRAATGRSRIATARGRSTSSRARTAPKTAAKTGVKTGAKTTPAKRAAASRTAPKRTASPSKKSSGRSSR